MEEATSAPARAPVCEKAARAPASVRPDFTAMIGFFRVTRWARRVNFRGFPKLSRYIRMTPTAGSSSQYSIRSLPEMSALFPTLANMEIPSWICRALARMISPSAPDWDMKPAVPRRGAVAAKVALSRTAGSVLMTPMQLGPTIRIPALRTRSRISASSFAPSSPTSR